jgi:hypothetical protein
MYYIAGMLINEATNRYHPIIFYPAPLPGGDMKVFPRYKSKGHHTIGFDTLDEAQAYLKANPDWFDTGLTWKWDGVEMPAMVIFFEQDENKANG